MITSDGYWHQFTCILHLSLTHSFRYVHFYIFKGVVNWFILGERDYSASKKLSLVLTNTSYFLFLYQAYPWIKSNQFWPVMGLNKNKIVDTILPSLNILLTIWLGSVTHVKIHTETEKDKNVGQVCFWLDHGFLGCLSLLSVLSV